ncbi:MAG: hypothetical protein HS101_17075 [Planctomycetia bacterium]|nr:hypothetical protein [Planctomycetia bacterium]
MTWTETIRRAVERSGLSMNAVAKLAEVPYPRVHRLMSGDGLTLRVAEKIGRAVGLELRPAKGKVRT